jgi:hypothetical protein
MNKLPVPEEDRPQVLYSTAQYGNEEPDVGGPSRTNAWRAPEWFDRNALPPAEFALTATSVESMIESPAKASSWSNGPVHDPVIVTKGYAAAWVTTNMNTAPAGPEARKNQTAAVPGVDPVGVAGSVTELGLPLTGDDVHPLSSVPAAFAPEVDDDKARPSTATRFHS